MGTAARLCTLIVPRLEHEMQTATLSGQSSNTKTVNPRYYSVALSCVSSTLNDNGWDVISKYQTTERGLIIGLSATEKRLRLTARF